ncbi:unnamed protein product [Auanema sp. JU1783]|nr:unnamed protein product [Auanema sp. JU1783]
MDFLKAVRQSSQLLNTATQYYQEFKSQQSKEKPNEIEKISESRLKKMLKLDNLTNFSCHSESNSNGPCFYAIFIPGSQSVYKSTDEKLVRQLCAKLNPLGSVHGSNLENLMKIVWEEPDWSTLHYAVACGIIPYLTTMLQKDKELVFNHATCDGKLPLNIAAEKNQIAVLQLLLKEGAPLHQQDALGRTVVHWAAVSDVAILQELSCSPNFNAGLLVLDGDGLSPLSLAIRASNFETVKLLMGLSVPLGPLKSGPLLNAVVNLPYKESLGRILELITIVSPTVIEQVDGNGKTVMHKSLDKKVLSAILKNSAVHINIDKKDNQGNTPLHSAVERGDLDHVTSLLTFGANPNVFNGKDETPLMKAVQGAHFVIIKALLLFDANIELKNAKGEDVFNHSSVSKKRADIEKILKQASLPSSVPPAAENAFDEFAQKLAVEYQNSVSDKNVNVVNLLSLDGGGIRGLVLIQILLELERRAGKPILPYFHWMAGTSTGAILALALCQGKDTRHCRNLYFKLKEDVFTGSRPFDASKLEEILKLEYGAETTMEKIGGNKKIFVTTCRGNVNPPQAKVIRSYKSPKPSDDSDPSKTLAWYAARCSSAAPSYFNAVDGKWMDGGLVANNPSCDLLTDVQNYNIACRMKGLTSAVQVGCLLSLGTGRAPIVSIDKVDLELPSLSNVKDIFTKINSLVHMKNLLIEQIASADGVAVSRAQSWTHSLPAPFFRFSPFLSSVIELDETKDDVLIEMMWQTKVYMASEEASVQQLVSFLIR